MRAWGYFRSYYRVNRDVWPDMSRRACVASAWRCWKMVRPEVKGTA